MVANPELAAKRNISIETIEKINNLHVLREKIYYEMIREEEKRLPFYDDELNKIELELQELWGFEMNTDYIKFWERPRCECPKIDNDDAYPSGFYTINENCPLHGGKN